MRSSMKKGTDKKTADKERRAKPVVSRPIADFDPPQGVVISAIEVEGAVQRELKEVYAEAKTQRFLRNLLQNTGSVEILPCYDSAKGFVYESVDSIFGEEADVQKATNFLESLTKLGILRRSFCDSVSTCPTCDSAVLTVHSSCIKCESHKLSKTSLTEHVPCGYIGEREKYSNGQCPKCGRNLDETPHRDMGRWYKCRDCGEKFEHPNFDVICRNCGKSFQIDDANLTKIWKYSLNERRRKEIRQNVASLESVCKMLTDLGFEIEAPGWVVGEKSGIRHQFSLIARKEISGRQRIIALDMFVGENEVPSSPIIMYIYKTSEVKVDLPVFIAVPKFSGSALSTAQGHNILLIEGLPEEADNIAQLKTEIQKRLKPKGFFQSLRRSVKKSDGKT